MFLIRRLARPVAILALTALLAPAAVAECHMPGSGERMPCCVHDDGAAAASSFNADCCTVQRPTSSNDQSTPVQTRGPETQRGVAVPSTAAFQPCDSLQAASVETTTAGPPFERLYQRLSSIRR